MSAEAELYNLEAEVMRAELAYDDARRAALRVTREVRAAQALGLFDETNRRLLKRAELKSRANRLEMEAIRANEALNEIMAVMF
jgi:hypothetical protein